MANPNLGDVLTDNGTAWVNQPWVPGPLGAGPPPGLPGPSAAPARVAVLAYPDEERGAVVDRVRSLEAFAVLEGQPDRADVVVYAAHRPRHLAALLNGAPHPARGVLLDWEGGVGPEVGALLGLSGYLHSQSRAWQACYCLQQGADGYSYAAEPFDGVFHRTRELGALQLEERQLLSLLACGRTHAQVLAHLHLSEPTLKRRVGALRKRLALSRGQSLAVCAARRLGLG